MPRDLLAEILDRLARLEEQMKAANADIQDIHDRGSERGRTRLHDLEQYRAAAKAAEAARDSAKSAIAAQGAAQDRDAAVRMGRRDRRVLGGLSVLLGLLAIFIEKL